MASPGRFVDVLRRGLDNAIANWPLMALRLGETVLLGVLAIVSALALVLPLLVSVGVVVGDIDGPEDLLAAFLAIAERWVVLVWIFVGLTVLAVLMLAVHAFFEAGRARILVAGERKAGPGTTGPRSRFAAFSAREWVDGGVDGWWPLFWIYNVIWGLAGMILLVPLLPAGLLVVLLHERPGAAIASGCIGLVLTVLLGILLAVIAGMWTVRSTAEWGLGGRSARQATGGGWAAIRDDFGRHLLVAVVMMVVGMAGSTLFAGMSFILGLGEGLGDSISFSLVTLPIRFAGSFLSSIVSAAMSTWYLASYSAIAVEGEGGTRNTEH